MDLRGSMKSMKLLNFTRKNEQRRGMNKLQQQVDDILNETEECKLVAEVYHIPNDDESLKNKIYLGLIANKSTNEMA
jgi:hypothetical protein